MQQNNCDLITVLEPVSLPGSLCLAQGEGLTRWHGESLHLGSRCQCFGQPQKQNSKQQKSPCALCSESSGNY